MKLAGKKRVYFAEEIADQISEEDLDKQIIKNCNEVIKKYRPSRFDGFKKNKAIFIQSKIILDLYERIYKLKIEYNIKKHHDDQS
jgi:hypothetical protein